MPWMKETTEWRDSTPNHTYFLNSGGKMVAYLPLGKSEPVVFAVPRGFDKRGRKFVRVDTLPDPTQAKERTWLVSGSKGSTYTVTEADRGLVCTCSGFQFRGQCKHINQVQQESI